MQRSQKPKIRAIFVRHAEVPEQGKLAKGVIDYPLDPAGKKHSVRIAKQVAKYKPQVVLTSPLERARHVAREVGKRTGAPVRVKQNLLPWDFGRWGGKPAEKIEPKLSRLAKNAPSRSTPGGESFNAWLAKSDRGIQDAKRLSKTAGPVAVVTHSRNLRELNHSLYGDAPADPTKGGPEPGEMRILTQQGKLITPKRGKVK